MHDLDILLKESEIIKNDAEAEKFKAEKRRQELEVKHLSITFYLKPIIAGLALAFGLIPIYFSIVKPLYEAEIAENKKENKHLSDSLAGIAFKLSEKEKQIKALETLPGEKNRYDSLINMKDSLINSLYAQIPLSTANRSVVEKQKEKIISITKPSAKTAKTILWVTDDTKLYSTFIEGLESQGFSVVKSLGTKEAVANLNKDARKYSFIISDMARYENGDYIEDAGLQLLTELEERNLQNKLIFYSRNVDETLRERLAKKKITITNDYNKILKFIGLK